MLPVISYGPVLRPSLPPLGSPSVGEWQEGRTFRKRSKVVPPPEREHACRTGTFAYLLRTSPRIGSKRKTLPRFTTPVGSESSSPAK